MKKRIISAVLGVLLILSVMPCVFAETEQIDFVKLADITAYRFDENGERVELSGADMVKQRFWEMKYVFTTSVADEYDLPIYMEFDFKGITLSPECFEIYVRYAYYNGINKVRLEYMKDGEWEIAKDNINFDWKESGSTMECNNIVVPKNISSDKFRLVLEEIKPSAKTIRVEYISILGKMSEASVGGAVRPEYRRVSVGQDTVLPETVTLLCGDGRTETTAYEIDWPAVDSKKEGTYTVYGTAFGGAVKVKGIVDVYDPEINNNMDHWACDLSVTAKKYGYSQGIQGIDENLDAPLKIEDAAKIMFRMFNMNFEFPQNYVGESDDNFYQTVRKYIPEYSEKDFTRAKAFTMLANYASTKSYEKESLEPAFDDTESLSKEKSAAAKEAVGYGIISNGGSLRADDTVTAAEFLKMCFNLKKTGNFQETALTDTGENIITVNSGRVISCEDNTDEADVIYVKRDSADIANGEKYNFSYIDTQIAEARKAGKKVAVCITNADEALTAAFANKYKNTAEIAFIDAENSAQAGLWQKAVEGVPVYIAEGDERDSGRYSFSKDCGSRIMPAQIRYSQSCNHDEAFLFNINWQNLSDINADTDLYPTITLKTLKGNEAAVMTDVGFNLKDLKGGSRWEYFTHRVHSHLGGDTYAAYLSVGSITGDPLQELPIDLPTDGEGRYYIGDIRLHPICNIDVYGIDDENNMKVKVSFSDTAGEYDLNDVAPVILFILREPGKELFSSAGDMTVARAYRKTTPGFTEAVVNRTSVEFEVPFVVTDTLRGKKVTRNELLGRTFELWTIPFAYTGGYDQWTVIGDGGTMQKQGYVTIKEGKTEDSYSFDFKEAE